MTIATATIITEEDPASNLLFDGISLIRASRKLLRRAKIAHSQRHSGHKVVAGMNFVWCENCGKHAHIQGDKLLIHNADYSVSELVNPEQF